MTPESAHSLDVIGEQITVLASAGFTRSYELELAQLELELAAAAGLFKDVRHLRYKAATPSELGGRRLPVVATLSQGAQLAHRTVVVSRRGSGR